MTATRDRDESAPSATWSAPGTVHVVQEGRETRVVLAGEVDVDLAPALAEAADSARAAGAPIEVDASGVSFMDSTGVAFLARLAVGAQPRVRLVRPADVVRFLLDVTGVDALLDVDTREPGGPAPG